jgi:hypothetical protein
MTKLSLLVLVREAAIREGVAALLSDLDFAGDEDGGEGLLDYGPEDGHRGAHDGKVDLEAGQDDADGGPPGKVDVGVGGSAVVDNGVEAPDGGEDDAGKVSFVVLWFRSVVHGDSGCRLREVTYTPPTTKMLNIAIMFCVLKLGFVNSTIGVTKTVISKIMFSAVWLSNRPMKASGFANPKP